MSRADNIHYIHALGLLTLFRYIETLSQDELDAISLSLAPQLMPKRIENPSLQ